jgi:hypothetical protein
MTRANRYSPEVRERAVRMLHEKDDGRESVRRKLTYGRLTVPPDLINRANATDLLVESWNHRNC